MSVLSNHIEAFIKAMMTQEEGTLEVQRNELAEHFGCAPSQINYVLATRFTVDQGYLIESRRGGGGYIRIIRISFDSDEYLYELITSRIGQSIAQQGAQQIIGQLASMDVISQPETHLMLAAITDKAIGLPSPLRGQVRANILRSMILAIAQQRKTENGGDSIDL